ncbi:tRNA uridine(34) 5-carboxymethylaminomethyl modification radical SAM/GNAT enzyme Elp3, partial [Candidatus Micrarchaeota archaeon]|nr:tRNA uridine(34) 5-carboxymethylaminomethyl modification radical SAM/GNAT enzyme Elp3 [Candidatus Micrarchaeota archaeon]
SGIRSASLAQAIDKNEKTHHRVIGLTIETRPDVCVPYIDEMLSFGATRVELGVQHADDEIYKKINRGHGVNEVVESTIALKNSAFKVLYHVMPGLPGVGRDKDIAFVKKLFDDSSFRPDMLKIYPTLVMGGTILYNWMKQGKYEPYSTEEAADIISEFYRYIPKYVRVMRIQRDIPAPKIERGVKKSNLRELVEEKLREKKIVPMEIRYREVGLQTTQKTSKNKKTQNSLKDFELKKLEYEASGGKEYFLSYENEDSVIAGFIRLRLPGSGIFPRSEIDRDSALIRELHVYGSATPLDESGPVQHHGFGITLLREAQEIAKAAGRNKMIIISGVGVRDYYRKHGYEREGPYMVKKL